MDAETQGSGAPSGTLPDSALPDSTLPDSTPPDSASSGTLPDSTLPDSTPSGTPSDSTPSDSTLPDSAPPHSSTLPNAIALSQLIQRAKFDFDHIFRLRSAAGSAALKLAALRKRVQAAAVSINAAYTTAQGLLRAEVAMERTPQFLPGMSDASTLLPCYAELATPEEIAKATTGPDAPLATPEEIAEATTELDIIEAEIRKISIVGVHTPTIGRGGPLQAKVRAPTFDKPIPLLSLQGLPDHVLKLVFSYLRFIDLASAQRVCLQFNKTARSAAMSVWTAMAQEPRSLDYVQERLGKICPGADSNRFENLRNVALTISMWGGTCLQPVERISLLYTHKVGAPFITPAILLERRGPGTFQLAEPKRPPFIHDASLPLCLLRSACIKPCLALSYKVLPSSADFAWLQGVIQCALEPAAAYVVSWNDKGKHYITVYQIADGIAELKTAIAITDHSWVRLYPGCINGALPAMGRYECIFTLSRIIAAICCNCVLQAERSPYAKIKFPQSDSTVTDTVTGELNLGQCRSTDQEMQQMKRWMCENDTAEGAGKSFAKTYAGKLAKALAMAFIECKFTSPSASYSTPKADAAGDPLDVVALCRALDCC